MAYFQKARRHASRADHDFTQEVVQAIREDQFPGDTWVQVLSPRCNELNGQTVVSLKGARRNILLLYLATCPCFMRGSSCSPSAKSLRATARVALGMTILFSALSGKLKLKGKEFWTQEITNGPLDCLVEILGSVGIAVQIMACSTVKVDSGHVQHEGHVINETIRL